jgi:LysM repeat protein
MLEALALAATIYTVKPGDCLSMIGAHYHVPWQEIYQANRSEVGSNPDLIYPNQRFVIPHGKWVISVSEDPDNDSDDRSGDTARISPSVSRHLPSYAVSLGNYSGFQACVIARESGGNSQVMNASGHYGLYQFSLSTWEAYGGSGALFGHASVAYQNMIFANAMRDPNGRANWSPYDGCLCAHSVVDDINITSGSHFDPTIDIDLQDYTQRYYN